MNININEAKFEITAVSPKQYPLGLRPEVAFVGRSNVGKSSIINTLLNRKNLARVGATPGKTREINFYNIEDKLFFVDLPGYGYAKVSKDKKSSWGEIIETYLHSRPQLKLIIMMLDIRHTPTGDDKIMHEWIKDRNTDYIIVATKADKVSRSQINPRLADIRKTLSLGKETPVITFSAESKQGREEILEYISSKIDTLDI